MKDAVGNEIHVGDLVLLQLDRPLMYGRIVEAVEGGLVTGINQELRPGRLVIAANYPIDFDPRQLVKAVVRLHDDQNVKQREKEEAIGSSAGQLAN
jgi:hypothetical protein